MILTLALRTCWIAREVDSMCCIVNFESGNLAAGGVCRYTVALEIASTMPIGSWVDRSWYT